MHDQFSFASQTGFETVTKRFCRIDTDPEERDELPERPAHRAGCAVIGCGAVGIEAARALSDSALFPSLLLIDPDPVRADALSGELSRALPFRTATDTTPGDYDALVGRSVVVLALDSYGDTGESRLETAARNLRLLRPILREVRCYAEGAVLIVATPPVDLMTYAVRAFTDFPPSRVIGTGTLADTLRLRYLLGNALSLPPKELDALVIGAHQTAPIVPHSTLTLKNGGSPRPLSVERALLDECIEEITHASHLDFSSSHVVSPPAEAVRRIASAVARDSHEILPVSLTLSGECGLTDVALSLPASIGREGIREILPPPLGDSESERLRRSAETLGGLLDALLP